jgi:hypothetical protein
MDRRWIKRKTALAAVLIYALALHGLLAAWSGAVQAAPAGVGAIFAQLCRNSPGSEPIPHNPAAALHCLALCATVHAGVAGPSPSDSDALIDPIWQVAAVASYFDPVPTAGRTWRSTLGARGPPQLG